MAEAAPHDDLRNLAARLSGAPGTGLFAVMAQYIATLLQASEVLIGEAADEHHARTLGVCVGGAAQPNYTFPLAGSPCEALVRGGEEHAEAPADGVNGSEPGYFGMTLHDGAGHVAGFVCARSSAELHITEHQHCLIEIVAILLTSELLLLRAERDRTDLEGQLLRLRAELDAVEREEVTAAASGVHHRLNLDDTEVTGLHHVQREHILRVLNATRWVIEGNSGAALKLGMKPATLRHRMKKLGIARGMATGQEAR